MLTTSETSTFDPSQQFPSIVNQIRFHYENNIDGKSNFEFPAEEYELLASDLQIEGGIPTLPPSLQLELLNTKIGDRAAERYYRRLFFPILSMQRMSTIAVATMINAIVSQLRPDQCYLNIGVWHGFTFFSGLLNNPDKLCIGVDNFSEFTSENASSRDAFYRRFLGLKTQNHFFFESGYERVFDDFLKTKIGFYLYDGAHDYDNQLKSLLIAEPFLAKDCIIMVDDTNFQAARQATLDFLDMRKTQYRLLFDLPTPRNLYPTWWNGIMILQKLW